MLLKNLLTLLVLSLTLSLNAQTKPDLAKKIESLAQKVIPNVNSEDVFIKSGKAGIGTAEYKMLKQIVMTNGFPTITKVGKEVSHKFWMMVQLCDHDIAFQIAILKQMGRAVRKGDVIKEDYAMLTDRTRMNRGVPQLYGTQYVYNDFGDLILYEVYDEQNINERRKTLSLSKINDAEKKVKAIVKATNDRYDNMPGNDRPN